jgi:hypothetical protein
MKVAVCVSGLMYPDSEERVKDLMGIFSKYDFFFGTWKGRETEFGKNINVLLFDEFQPKYHPYFDTGYTWPPSLIQVTKKLQTSTREAVILDKTKSLHQTKQIIIHSHMLDSLPKDYDMIIRTRFDINLCNKSIPFEKLLQDSYNTNKAIGFHPKSSVKNGGPSYWKTKKEGYLFDNMIFHPKNLFNKEKMWNLHNTNKLLAAEFGWYQVLSDPNNNHDCYYADISVTRELRDYNKGLYEI